MRSATAIAMAATVMTLGAGTAAAQTTVPPVTTASPGYLFPNDQYQRGREEQRRRANTSGSQRSSAPDRACSVEALPVAERRAMEARFAEIDRTRGRQAANAYVHDQGRRFAQRLVAEGICTEDGRTVSSRR